jgi:phage terminase large subunit-like protein
MSAARETKAEKKRRIDTEAWIRNESDREAVRQGCYFDPDEAEAVLYFFETFLYHSVGRWAGQPFRLEKWQKDYLYRLFGWRKPNGFRRFKETYLEVPKKNGKSTLFAGICLFLIFEEAAAEVLIGAVNRKQAKIIFNECARMVRSSPYLKKHLRIVQYTSTIILDATDSRIVTMSADVAGQDGANATAAVLDELHRLKTPQLYDVVKYAGLAREQFLLVNITTAGTDRNSICYQQHQRGRAVLNGSPGDIHFLPVIYGIDDDVEDEKLDDEELWKSVNPSLGIILSLEDFRNDFNEAKQIPGKWNNFKRLRLNIWNRSAALWLDAEKWESFGSSRFDDEHEFDATESDCFVGVDLSDVKDLTAITFAVIDPPGEIDDEDEEPDDPTNRIVRFYTVFFLPKETAEQRAIEDKVPYLEWIEQGHIIATEGNAVDYEAIRKYINDRRDINGWNIRKIAFDPMYAQHLMTLLNYDGFSCVRFPQTYRHLSPASKELERRILSGTLRHNENPVMKWCVQNCSVETDTQGNIMPSKKKSHERIDGVPATVMALALTMGPADPTPGMIVVKKGQ